ncbi:hypothetical protein [Methanomethylovorans sp.]|uniref:hypothetical protein n=1 Tax=Methanomethylovorans sp. TaxID=2758717 RepID=UPI00351CA59F
MSANKNVKKAPEKEKDITVPTMEEEIDAWCKLPPQPSKSKSIADIEIDAWCAGSPDSAIEQEKKKKN